MNARKAKALRKGAIQAAENATEEYPHVACDIINQRMKKYYVPDGERGVKEVEMLTYTQIMKPCVRKIYQMAKKKSKR